MKQNPSTKRLVLILKIQNSKKALLQIKEPTPDLISISQRLEGYRRWGPNGLTLEPTGHNIELLKNNVYNLTIQKKPTEDVPLLTYPRKRFEYKPKTKPYPFQAEALDKMKIAHRNSPGFCLWCDPGTGKSKVAIDFMGHLYASGVIDYVIVVAPKGVHRQWAEDQIPTHCGVYEWNTHWWYPMASGRNWISWHEGQGLRWYTINYDALRTPRGELSIDRITATHPGHERFGLVIDESHFVKNYRAKRWKLVYALGNKEQCKSKILLSGTPITKALEDEWAQLRIADERILGIKYVTHFRNNYCVMGGYQGREYLGPQNLKRYRSKTSPFIYRATKNELKGLPEKVYNRWFFTLTDGLKSKYRDMKNELIVRLKNGEFATAANAAVAVMKLQQISNGFLKTDPETDPVALIAPHKNPRIIALKQLIDSFDKRTQAIIWCRFRYDVETVCKLWARVAVPLYGGTADRERARNLEKWIEGESRFLVATPGTGGTGLNLQVGGCNHAIYYSNSEHFTHRIQSEDRIHRIGASGDQTIYYDLIARGSRDMPILANLRRKKSLSDLVLDELIQQLEGLR